MLRLLGGGDIVNSVRSRELGIAPGGMIKQNIRQDHYDSDKWLKDLVFPISVQLLNSASYKCVTGESPLPCPIDAKAYADAGLPFFDLFEEEDSGVARADAFATSKSVHEMQMARGELKAEDTPVRP